MTNAELLAEIERLAIGATLGPWTVEKIEYDKYGLDVSFEINTPHAKPVLQTIMRERGEVEATQADQENCELVALLRNNLPAILSALRGVEAARDLLRPRLSEKARTMVLEHIEACRMCGDGKLGDALMFLMQRHSAAAEALAALSEVTP